MSDKYCVLQDDLKDCGVCALLSIIKYYDGDISKEYLRELTKTNKNGVSALNLLKAARELGFEAYGVKSGLSKIKNEYLPVIAHVTIDKKYNHFVVIYKIDKKKNQVLLMDPTKGFVYISFSNFMNISTSYFLILRKKTVIPKLVLKNDCVSNIVNVIKKYYKVIVIIMFISFFYTIINIVSSYNFKLLFDELLITKDNDLLFILILLMLLSVFKYIIHLLRNILINKLNFIIDKQLVLKSYNHIINLPYLYYKNHTNGDLLTRINDLGNIKELIGNFFATVMVDLTLAIVILVVMININSVLTLIIIICLLLYSIITLLYNKIFLIGIRTNYEKSSIVNNYLVESLASFETIKNLSLQKYICGKFKEKYNDFNLIKEKLFIKINNCNFLKESILSIGNLIVLFMGIKYLKKSDLNITSLITFVTLSNYLIEPIKKNLDLQFLYQNTKESIRRIKEIYNIPVENLLDTKHNIKNMKGNILISNVSYSYNSIDNVFNNVSMEINEGDKVLIYGDSGSGKSTLMRLLIKYLDNNYKGNIILGGYDLKNINTSTLRKNICYVSQNEYLYTDTIYENIVLNRKIPYKRFLDIAKNVYIDEIIKNSNLGYNYLIENNGENISGGERMRIMIARSIISEYNIFIYDETFSAIDPIMERNIIQYIFDLYKNKTIIIISHRKSNMDLFNKVISLEGGSDENRWFIWWWLY